MRLFIIFLGCLGFMAVPRLIGPPVYSAEVQSAIGYFQAQSDSFAASCTKLRKSCESLQPANAAAGAKAAAKALANLSALSLARRNLIDCRLHYKKIESFLEYFFRSSATIYNRPPKFEPEEPDMEYQSPAGLQVIESLLYETRPDRPALLLQARAVESSAADLTALLYDLKADDRQLLESLRVELIRVMALDITGYEAPLLKSGIAESREALRSFSFQLQSYLHAGEPRSDSIRFFLNKGIVMTGTSSETGNSSETGTNVSFDSFDRLAFMRQALLPLQHQLSLFIRERGLELNTNKVLNYQAENLFSADALLVENFPGGHPGSGGHPGTGGGSLAGLGKRLFSDTSLSGNGQKSCASCHSPDKMFTDRLPVSIAFDGHHLLERNAPSLLYSGFQYNQFWDGRAHSLEEQIRTVLCDPREMNADTATLTQKGGIDRIATAIAAYVRTLHPMNSPFDRYMRGESGVLSAPALSARAIKGANLFMGKAQCATCHFIPLFNGLVPPDYAMTEFEVLGSTRTDHLDKTALSPDAGRYKIYPFPFYKGAFKTPTVRNAALTYPYMHNGAFRDLKKLMEFYNKGGGAGLGLRVPDQTLSSVPLHLSPGEIDDIILFIHTLTDTLYQKS